MSPLPEHPLVSVLLPTYNRARFLPQALESAFSQTYPHWEILVIDDGSTDETSEVLKDYEGRVRVVRQENQGPAAARNHGLRLAQGPLIAFLDSDDVWRPERLERGVAHLREHPEIGLVCSGIHHFRDDEGRYTYLGSYIQPPAEASLAALAEKNFISTQTVLMRREVTEKAGVFAPDIPVRSDYEYWLRVAMHTPVAYLPEDLVGYRLHGKNLNGNDPLLQAEHGQRIWRRFEERRPEIFAGIGLAPSQVKARALMASGRHCAHDGAHFGAARLYLRSFLLEPQPRKLLVAGMAVLRGLRGVPGKPQGAGRDFGALAASQHTLALPSMAEHHDRAES